ncbi:MAG: acyl--CoA ligase [Desulfobacter sp.]|nr:MAG: acyl--CoA ligase [Desulfobacter sp.]
MKLSFNRPEGKKSFSDDLISSIRMNVSKSPDNIAVTFEGNKLTWADVWERSSRLANGLMGPGLQQHDRVLIFLPNCLEYPEAILGINKAGCIVTGGNVRLTGPEIAYQLNDSQARAIILKGPEELETILSVKDQIPELNHIIMIDDKPVETVHNYNNLIADNQPTELDIEKKSDDIHLLLYTSGTTGKPKAAARTYKCDYHMAVAVCHEMALGPADIYLAVAPMYAAASMGYVLSTMMSGGTVAIVSGFVPDQFFAQLEKTRATWTFVVPIMYEWALKTPEDILNSHDISKVRCFIACGAPLSNATAIKMVKRFPNAQVVNWLGASEFGFISKYVCKETMPPEGCVGKPLFDLELAVFDNAGKKVSAKEPGVLYGRGYSMFEGYLNKPEATRKTFLDHEWGTVEDIATLGDDGNFYIIDRKKDMIITGGMNVYPVEVENILMSHDAVADVAVIGVPDDKWGEAVKALVVSASGKKSSEEELIEYCREKLAGFKMPKSVEFIDAVPRSPIGKALKHKLRGKYWTGKDTKI